MVTSKIPTTKQKDSDADMMVWLLNLSNWQIIFELKSSKIHLFPTSHFHEDKFREDRAITKDLDYLKNIDKQAPLDRYVRYLTGQAKVHDLEKHFNPVRCLLPKGDDRMVYKFHGITPDEIAFMAGRKCK